MASPNETLSPVELVEQIKRLGSPGQRYVAGELGRARIPGLPDPERRTANLLWLIVVTTLSFVVLGAAGGLIATAFLKSTVSTIDQIILTIFTTASAGLIGLFIPSPAQRRQDAPVVTTDQS